MDIALLHYEDSPGWKAVDERLTLSADGYEGAPTLEHLRWVLGTPDTVTSGTDS
ncbi:MAG: hypothetical protein ABIQ13_08335 [Pedococcus sp.]